MALHVDGKARIFLVAKHLVAGGCRQEYHEVGVRIMLGNLPGRPTHRPPRGVLHGVGNLNIRGTAENADFP
jgi:hypothetical protein